MHTQSSTSVPSSAHLPDDMITLAALCRQGLAAAFAALQRRCRRGRSTERAAAIRLLPGLVPFQPVAALLSELEQSVAPPLVRQAVAQARGVLDDPRQCEATYRTIQRSLTATFLATFLDSVPEPACRRVTAEATVRGLYDYRFSWSDGSIGDLQPRHIEEYLLEYAPRHLLLAPDQRAQAARALARFLSWLGQVGRLSPERARTLAILALALDRRYQALAAAPRSGLAAAAAAGVAMDDAAAVQRFVTLRSLDLHDEFCPVFF